MTKVKQALHFLNNGCYPGFVMFSYNFSYDEITKLLKKKKANSWLMGINGDKQLIDAGSYFALKRTMENSRTKQSITMFYIIITKEFKFTDYEYCKLAHECLHICQFFLPDLMDRNKEIEAEAYYHTHLMNQCLDVLRGNKK